MNKVCIDEFLVVLIHNCGFEKAFVLSRILCVHTFEYSFDKTVGNLVSSLLQMENFIAF